jgi:hypothetical protein
LSKRGSKELLCVQVQNADRSSGKQRQRILVDVLGVELSAIRRFYDDLGPPAPAQRQHTD